MSKTHPSNIKKSSYIHKGLQIRGIAPHYFVFFHFWWVPTPLVSRQVCFFAKISKKSGYNHKGSKSRDVAPQHFEFFDYWGCSPQKHLKVVKYVGFTNLKNGSYFSRCSCTYKSKMGLSCPTPIPGKKKITINHIRFRGGGVPLNTSYYGGCGHSRPIIRGGTLIKQFGVECHPSYAGHKKHQNTQTGTPPPTPQKQAFGRAHKMTKIIGFQNATLRSPKKAVII